MRTIISVLSLFTACQFSRANTESHSSINGSLSVYRVAGGLLRTPVHIDSTTPCVVDVVDGVQMRISEQTAELSGYRRFSQVLELHRGSKVRNLDLSWIEIPLGRDYSFQICDSLYEDESRWSIKKPLAGIISGEVRILAIRDDLRPRSIKFDLDLAHGKTVMIAAGVQLTITSYWSRTGFVSFAHRFRKEVAGQVVDEWDGPGFSVLPGSSYLYEFADSVYEQHEGPNQALLPTTMTVTPPAGQEPRRP